jgi:integrase
MQGHVYKRCGCPTRKDEQGKIVMASNGKAERVHKANHRPSWAFVHDAPARANGRRHQVSKAGFSNKRDAERALAVSVKAYGDGMLVDDTRVTVGQYLDQWLEGKVRLRPNTVRAYRSHIEQYLKPHLGHVRLHDLRAAHVHQMLVALRELDGRGQRLRGAATVERIHATLRSALATAHKRQQIPYNPAYFVELEQVPRPALNVWNPAELARFLLGTVDDELHPLFYLVSFTGLRRGEAVGLRWEDVDLTRGVLHICRQMVQPGREYFEAATKSHAGTRHVQLDPETTEMLRSHAVQTAVKRAAWGAAWHDTGYVFVRGNGTPHRPDYVTRRFSQLQRGLDVRRIRLHDLRHTHATCALAANVDIKVVQERLGHSSRSITSDIYTSVMPDVATSAAADIAAYARSGLPAALLASREQGANSDTPIDGSVVHLRRSEGWGGWGSNPGPTDYESAALTG